MQAPKFPGNEDARLAALHSAGLLDQPAEERFDRLTRLAQQVFGVETVLVSLVDSQRQWFMSRQGLDAAETPRDISFCGHAILGPDLFLIEDASQDPRFADNPLVTDAPFIRFYAGQPLRTPSGHSIGTLCLIDPSPRSLDERQMSMLRDFGASVEEVILERMTERSAARRAVFLAATLDSMSDGILCVDAQRRIVMANAGAGRLLDISMQRLQESSLAELLDDSEALLSSGSAERLFSASDGRELPLEFSVTPLVDGQPGEVLILVRDLTEQKRLAHMQRQFVSTVSHELRTPLTSLRGALDLILARYRDDVDSKHANLLNMASRNTQRLTRLINDLLDLEKMQSGEMSLHLRDVDLQAIARQAIEEFASAAAAAGVDIRLESMEALPLVRGDHDRLVQVVGNLLSNAVKQSKAGQVVTVELGSTDHRVRLSVCDRGAGIPEEFRERVFQRFAQADGTDSREKGGTGLGLSICKAIVDALGGDIGFQTEPGVMTRFHIELGAVRAPFIDTALNAAALVVEDNDDIAEVFRELLAQEGMPADRVASAEDALELLKTRRYRLMLLDLMLPGMNGLELLDQLASMPEHRAMRTIVTSAKSEEGRNRAVAIGARVIDWLPKPVKAARLVAAIQRAMAAISASRVLHVEDDTDVQQVVQLTVGDAFEYVAVGTLAEGGTALATGDYDLLILDVGLPDGSGEALLEQVPEDFPVILYSGTDVTGELALRITAQLDKATSGPQELVDAVRSVLGGARSSDR